MASIRVSLAPVTRTSQPQFAAQVDWSNPITKGLVVASTGADRYDKVTSGTFAATGAIATDISTTGIGFVSNGSDASYVEFIQPIALTSATIFAVLKSNGNAIGTDAFALGSSSNGNPLIRLTADSSDATKLQVFVRNDGGAILSGVTSTASPFNGKVHTAGLVYTGSTAQLFIDGGRDVSGSISGTVTIDRVSIGALRRAVSSNFWSGSNYVNMVWNRALSPAEIASLSANPWQIFK